MRQPANASVVCDTDRTRSIIFNVCPLKVHPTLLTKLQLKEGALLVYYFNDISVIEVYMFIRVCRTFNWVRSRVMTLTRHYQSRDHGGLHTETLGNS